MRASIIQIVSILAFITPCLAAPRASDQARGLLDGLNDLTEEVGGLLGLESTTTVTVTVTATATTSASSTPSATITVYLYKDEVANSDDEFPCNQANAAIERVGFSPKVITKSGKARRQSLEIVQGECYTFPKDTYTSVNGYISTARKGCSIYLYANQYCIDGATVDGRIIDFGFRQPPDNNQAGFKTSCQAVNQPGQSGQSVSVVCNDNFA